MNNSAPDGIIYNRDSVEKSLEILKRSNNDFQEAEMQIRNALNILRNVKGQETIKKLENALGYVNPTSLLTMCNDNIGETISNMKKSANSIEEYLKEGSNAAYPVMHPTVTSLSTWGPGSGQPGGGSQPTPPSQPQAPSGPGGAQTTGPNGEQPPSPPSQPQAPSSPGGAQTTGPNGEQPPSPPTQPQAPSGPGGAQTTGPNGEQPPSPPSQPQAPSGPNDPNAGQVGPNGEQPPSPPSGPPEQYGQTQQAPQQPSPPNGPNDPNASQMGPNGEKPPEPPSPPNGPNDPNASQMGPNGERPPEPPSPPSGPIGNTDAGITNPNWQTPNMQPQGESPKDSTKMLIGVGAGLAGVGVAAGVTAAVISKKKKDEEEEEEKKETYDSQDNYYEQDGLRFN